MTDREKWALFGVLLLIFILVGALMLYLGHTQEKRKPPLSATRSPKK